MTFRARRIVSGALLFSTAASAVFFAASFTGCAVRGR
jgi:hypothetical protein